MQYIHDTINLSIMSNSNISLIIIDLLIPVGPLEFVDGGLKSEKFMWHM